jgi:hypothetical protein
MALAAWIMPFVATRTHLYAPSTNCDQIRLWVNKQWRDDGENLTGWRPHISSIFLALSALNFGLDRAAHFRSLASIYWKFDE